MFTEKLIYKAKGIKEANYLLDQLVSFGYKEGCNRSKGYLFIVNNLGDSRGVCANIDEDKQRDRYEVTDPELFLALAAMTDLEYGGVGEWWKCTNGSSNFTVGRLYKALKPVYGSGALWDDSGNGNGFHPNNNNHFVKATKEELINHFKKQTQMEYLITRQQLKDIYNVACDSWKQQILSITGEYIEDFENEGSLPSFVVKRMFEAADGNQTKVLEGIFPDYKKDKNAFIKDIREDDLLGLNLCLGSDYGLEVSGVAADSINRPDLVNRALYIQPRYEVVLHKVPSFKGTVIEIKYK